MTTTLAEIGAVSLAKAEGLPLAAKGVPLHNGDGTIAAFAMVDPADFEWVTQFSWSLNGRGYAQCRLPGGGWRRLHRMIMGLAHGDSSREVDHINRDRLDNRRSNLRVVTRAQNRQNTPAIGGTSKYRGVCWDRSRGKWMATAKLNGRQNFIGRYDSEQAAADAAAAWRETHMPFSEN